MRKMKLPDTWTYEYPEIEKMSFFHSFMYKVLVISILLIIYGLMKPHSNKMAELFGRFLILKPFLSIFPILFYTIKRDT